MLTAYAEADGDAANGGQFAPLGLAKAKLLQVHARLQALCRGSRVKYGAVVCGTGLGQVLFCPPGLDYYALDWYDRTDAGIGSLSGPWLPDDAATITALTRIAAHCKSDT